MLGGSAMRKGSVHLCWFGDRQRGNSMIHSPKKGLTGICRLIFPVQRPAICLIVNRMHRVDVIFVLRV